MIHTVGNLTLLTSRLNSKVSNGPWVSDGGKRQGLEMHDVLVMNRELLKGFATETVRPRHRVDLGDLVSAEFLKIGAKLVPRSKKFRDQFAVVLSDGRIEWNNQFFSSPSLAGKAITGRVAVNGWNFFLVEGEKKLSLKELRIRYLEAVSADPAESEQGGPAVARKCRKLRAPTQKSRCLCIGLWR